jgi:hypothetical protein
LRLANWAIVYFRQFSENYRSVAHILGYFFHSASYALILTKVGWAEFWAIFSQTHLVTLDKAYRKQSFVERKRLFGRNRMQ